jgi:uncharacterized protein (DUF362 family)
MQNMSRREFFAESFGLLLSARVLKNLQGFQRVYSSVTSKSDLVIAQNGTPEELLEAALKKIGGIEKVVKKGQKVVIKVNISFNMTPEQAVTTNPELVEALVRACRGAGAKEVLVVDHTIQNWKMCMDSSQMKEHVERAGGKIKAINYDDDYRWMEIPRGETLRQTYISKDVLDADVFINVPIAKVHNSAVTTLSMKNLMGIVLDRGDFHMRGLHECIADLSTFVKPDLIILDAYRILMTGGPGGPGRVKEAGEVVVGTDPVAVDVYGSLLLDKNPEDIRYIRRAASLGVGQMDMNKINTMYVDAQEAAEPVEQEEEEAEPVESIFEEKEEVGIEPVDTEEKEAGIPAIILIPALVISFLIGLRMRRKNRKEEMK